MTGVQTCALPIYVSVVIGVDDDSDVLVILRSAADHGWAADVDVLEDRKSVV